MREASRVWAQPTEGLPPEESGFEAGSASNRPGRHPSALRAKDAFSPPRSEPGVGTDHSALDRACRDAIHELTLRQEEHNQRRQNRNQ